MSKLPTVLSCLLALALAGSSAGPSPSNRSEIQESHSAASEQSSVQRETTPTVSTVDKPTPRTPPQPWVFVVPHQDDELLSMSTLIKQAVDSKRPVYVFYTTNYISAVQRSAINATQSSLGEKLLTDEELGHSRNASAIDSLKTLGVTAENISYPSYDDTIPQQNPQKLFHAIVALFSDLNQKYPHATFVTMSWLDRHPDHYRLGYALDDLCTSGKISSCFFTQSSVYRVNTPSNALKGVWPVPTPPITCDPLPIPLAQAAAIPYIDRAPQKFWYSTGYVSVPDQFNYFLKNPQTCHHGNSKTWVNQHEKTVADAWLKKEQTQRP